MIKMRPDCVDCGKAHGGYWPFTNWEPVSQRRLTLHLCTECYMAQFGEHPQDHVRFF